MTDAMSVMGEMILHWATACGHGSDCDRMWRPIIARKKCCFQQIWIYHISIFLSTLWTILIVKFLKAASMYRAFRELQNLQQGNMDFELFASKVTYIVDKLKLYDKKTFLKYLIVNGANSRRAFSQVLDLGPNATLEKILEIYRNDASVERSIQIFFGIQFGKDR